MTSRAHFDFVDTRMRLPILAPATASRGAEVGPLPYFRHGKSICSSLYGGLLADGSPRDASCAYFEAMRPMPTGSSPITPPRSFIRQANVIMRGQRRRLM